MHSRLYWLIEKHQRIDEALRLAQHRREPDQIEIVRLKKLKLRVKDIIHRFTRSPAHA